MILAVDIGTSSVKAGIVREDGRLHAWGRAPLDPEGARSPNVDPRQWFEALAALTAGMDGADAVRAVCISGNGPTLVPLDRNGEPSAPTLFWHDPMERRLPGQPSFYLPKIAWFRESDPDAYERTRRFLSCPEYVSWLLCGEAWTVLPSPGFEQYLWSRKEIDAYGIDPDSLPPFLPAGRIMGSVRRNAAERLGIPADVPVVAGGPDFLMTLLGTGTVEDGMTCDRAGTSEGINHASKRPVTGQKLRSLPHIVPGLYNVAGILSSTGRLFEWFRAFTGQKDRSYRVMLREICDAGRAGSGPLFFPSLHEGATWEFERGIFFGLGPGHGRAAMGLAVVRSIGYAVREAVEIIEHHVSPVTELRVSGGQAKNPEWNQLKADIVGKPVAVPETEDAELIGCACCAFSALGAYADPVEAAKRMVRIRTRCEPDAQRHSLHTESYRTYVETYRAIRTALRGLSGT